MLARKTLLHFLNTVAGGILGAIALKLIALWMGDAVLGRVAYALGILNIVQVLFTLGFRHAHEKRLGEEGSEADRIGTYLLLQLGLSACFAASVGGGIAFWTVVLGKSFHATTLMTLVIIAAYLAAQNLRQVSVNTFNGRREIARSQTITFFDDVVRVGFTVIAAVFYAAIVSGRGPLAGSLPESWTWVQAYGSELLALTYLGGTIASSLVGLWYLHRATEIGSFRWDIVKDYWAYAAPVFFSGLLGTLATNVDRLMLGFFWTEAAVGLFFGVARVTHVLQSITFAITRVLIPAFSTAIAEGNQERVGEITLRSHRYTHMAVLPMVLGLIVFARPVIRILLADEFLRGTPVLVVLALWVFLEVTKSPYGAAVKGMDRPGLLLRISFMSVVLHILANLLLIPADIKTLGLDLLGLGALGAAIGTLFTSVFRYVGVRYYARQLLDLDPSWPYVLRQAFAGLVMAGTVWYLSDQLAVIRIYHVMGFALLGLVIYLAVLWIIGELDEEDLDFFADAANPKEMGTYIAGELFDPDEDDEDGDGEDRDDEES